ncbi:MAG: DUF512 domain-containing protein [Candidatus Cloacimonetes bacterium]|nr:DUF512 domain-containing protein [Candidatus Cloacimonadota bacterium]
MPLRIRSVEPKSLAAEAEIAPGDTLIRVNGEAIRDFLDLEFYASDFKLDLELDDRLGNLKEITIYRENSKPLGIIPEDYSLRTCNNHCIFCFIDQMPSGMRKTLYTKDDDFIFSFVYGNYITLSNLSEEDLTRICDQHISPLYVSIHTTNVELRQKMMRSAKAINPIQILRRLSKCDIAFHSQIVCVPGYNDKDELKNSIMDLMDSKLNVKSIGVVPVGLTKYRHKLCKLDSFTPQNARDTLAIIDELRALETGKRIFAADEFFVLADVSIPSEEYYADYPQLENGIGMLRLGERNFHLYKRSFLRELRKTDNDYHFLCSTSAQKLIQRLVKVMSNRLRDRKISLQVIRNEFFGGQVSVAGLITAQDILSQVQASKHSCIVVPSCIFNHEGYTLDNMSLEELKHNLRRDILVVDPLWEDWQLYSEDFT